MLVPFIPRAVLLDIIHCTTDSLMKKQQPNAAPRETRAAVVLPSTIGAASRVLAPRSRVWDPLRQMADSCQETCLRHWRLV